jgi:PAS domain S-box-containing protein
MVPTDATALPPSGTETVAQGRIVIVDDDPRVLTALCQTLAERGYEMQGFATGAEALAALHWTDVDVLLCDLMMPEIDGITLLYTVLEVAPDLVGIIMTGQGSIPTAVAAMQVGAFDYVLKPVTLSALLPVLSRAMIVRRLQAECRRAAEALRHREEHFRALIEHAIDIVAILNEDGTFRYLSPAITRVLGYQPAELLGTSEAALIHPDDLAGLWDTRARFLSTPGTTIMVEYRARHKDGSFRTLEAIGNNLLHNPAMAGTVINARDISERKEATRLKDDMIAVVSHELRTPLTSLRGFAELLLARELPPDKERQFLTIIHDETVRLSHLINDFLDLQRMQAGRQTYHRTCRDLGALLRDTVAVFTPEAGPHVIRIETADTLPPVHADAERLHQVLANLLSNAIKFSPHGGAVTVGARLDGAQVLVWVADQGLGIPPEALPKLFGKFFRVEHPETRHIGGTGLGLVLVKEIIEAHNGSVWVESVLGKGSTFFFTLPVAPPLDPSLWEHGA